MFALRIRYGELVSDKSPQDIGGFDDSGTSDVIRIGLNSQPGGIGIRGSVSQTKTAAREGGRSILRHATDATRNAYA